MSEALWQDEVDLTCEQFQARVIDEAMFRRRMRQLGFDPGEIDDYFSAMIEDMKPMPVAASIGDLAARIVEKVKGLFA